MKNRNVNTHFNNNPTSVNLPRSVFNRDHSTKFSIAMGSLVPFYVDEILPGDTVSIDTSKVVRIMPMVSPVMDEVFIDTYFFFVPNRLLWSKWTEFMGEAQEDTSVNPGSLVGADLTIPTVSFPNSITSPDNVEPFPICSLADYFGLPTSKATKEARFNALPFRAYQRIYNEWFRAENFVNPVPTYFNNSSNVEWPLFQSPASKFGYKGYPFQVNKTFDYFTSCLPSPQKGPTVNIAQNGTLPVYFSQQDNPLFDSSATVSNYRQQFSAPHFKYEYNNKFLYNSANRIMGNHSPGVMTLVSPVTESSFSFPSYDAFITNAVVEMKDAFMNVNDLRQAFAVQKYYEKSMRGGSRYIESIKTFFGVTSPDARMQRSEYLGGSRLYLDINQVVQTSSTDVDISPQGNVAGYSVTNDVHHDVNKSFTEHGYIIGLAVARQNHTYQYGVERLWSRSTLFDFYNPTFANIGEQPVYKQEIYFDSNDNYNNSVFGYNEAWADYRYKPSTVTSHFRSSNPQPLDVWHLADKYNSQVFLSSTWLEETSANLDRVLAVPFDKDYAPQIICDFYLKSRWARVMPLYSVPGLIDHN